MPIITLFQDPAGFVIFILAVIMAVSVHEAAHAWVADKLGDSTARALGRATINPIAHLDPLGSLLFLLIGFGWGHPVPVDERNLRRRYDIILVALAGPASNLITAIFLASLYRYFPITSLQPVFALFIAINISLMLFNLIPLPPLDGSKILRLFVSSETYAMVERYGILLILLLFYIPLGTAHLGDWLNLGVSYIYTLLTHAPLKLF